MFNVRTHLALAFVAIGLDSSLAHPFTSHASVDPPSCATEEASLSVRDLGGSLEIRATMDRIGFFNAIQGSALEVQGMVRKAVPFGFDQDYNVQTAQNHGFGMHSYATTISKRDLDLPERGATEIWVKFGITAGPDIHTCRVLVWR
ncbi:MAG: hypothetical protein ACKVVP_18495 [Chloroflexota bacterium]